MRDIIFRGKRTDGRGWAYGAYVECRLSWYRRHPHRAWIITDARSNGGWFAVGSRYPVVNDSVGQYTGYKDATGHMIFEGDIIKVESLCGVIRYGEHEPMTSHADKTAVGFYVEWLEGMNGLYRSDLLFWLNDRETVICGNIHDNPELMEVEA